MNPRTRKRYRPSSAALSRIRKYPVKCESLQSKPQRLRGMNYKLFSDDIRQYLRDIDQNLDIERKAVSFLFDDVNSKLQATINDAHDISCYTETRKLDIRKCIQLSNRMRKVGCN